MELKGKTLLFLGDSITAGSGVSGKEETYWYRLGQKTGASCIGYGVGGTRIAEQQQPDSFEALGNFCTRAQQMQKKADAIIVFGGTNDYGHGDAPLGTPQDRTPKTFYGALHTLILYLLNAYPTAQIVFLTPLHRVGETDRLYNERGMRLSGNLQTYVDIILAVCGEYGLPVLDLFRTSGLQPNVPIIKENFVPDGLHPNAAGHRRLAERLESFLKAL